MAHSEEQSEVIPALLRWRTTKLSLKFHREAAGCFLPVSKSTGHTIRFHSYYSQEILQYSDSIFILLIIKRFRQMTSFLNLCQKAGQSWLHRSLRVSFFG